MLDWLYRLVLRAGFQVSRRLPRLRRRRRQGVAIAVWHNDELLMVRHSYRPGLFLPGGNAGRRESLPEAARRELREEVGIDAETDALTPVFTTAWIQIFEYCPCERPAIRVDNREVVDAEFVDPEKLDDPPRYLPDYLLSRRTTRDDAQPY